MPDEYFADVLPAAKKIAIALGAENYNLLQVSGGSPCLMLILSRFIRTHFTPLQNNGRIAHQEVDHVHFHVIPKPGPSDTEGLVITWPAQKPSMDELKKLHEELVSKL